MILGKGRSELLFLATHSGHATVQEWLVPSTAVGHILEQFCLPGNIWENPEVFLLSKLRSSRQEIVKTEALLASSE